MKEQIMMSKTKELLTKAQKSVEIQKARIEDTKREMSEIDAKLDTAKIDLAKLSIEAQEKKLSELDALVLRKSQLEMRVKVLSGSNQDVLDNLTQAAQAFLKEVAEVNAKEVELSKKGDDLEAEYKRKMEENQAAIVANRDEKFNTKAKFTQILTETGMTKEEVAKFIKDHKLPTFYANYQGY